jgi:hypothetical protein
MQNNPKAAVIALHLLNLASLLVLLAALLILIGGAL